MSDNRRRVRLFRAVGAVCAATVFLSVMIFPSRPLAVRLIGLVLLLGAVAVVVAELLAARRHRTT